MRQFLFIKCSIILYYIAVVPFCQAKRSCKRAVSRRSRKKGIIHRHGPRGNAISFAVPTVPRTKSFSMRPCCPRPTVPRGPRKYLSLFPCAPRAALFYADASLRRRQDAAIPRRPRTRNILAACAFPFPARRTCVRPLPIHPRVRSAAGTSPVNFAPAPRRPPLFLTYPLPGIPFGELEQNACNIRLGPSPDEIRPDFRFVGWIRDARLPSSLDAAQKPCHVFGKGPDRLKPLQILADLLRRIPMHLDLEYRELTTGIFVIIKYLLRISKAGGKRRRGGRIPRQPPAFPRIFPPPA